MILKNYRQVRHFQTFNYLNKFYKVFSKTFNTRKLLPLLCLKITAFKAISYAKITNYLQYKALTLVAYLARNLEERLLVSNICTMYLIKQSMRWRMKHSDLLPLHVNFSPRNSHVNRCDSILGSHVQHVCAKIVSHQIFRGMNTVIRIYVQLHLHLIK